MSLRINSNIMAMNAYRNLSTTDKGMASSLEKLSSGLPRFSRCTFRHRPDAAHLIEHRPTWAL